MKILKTVAALVALAVASSAFAETSFKAFNKLSSDVVLLEKNGDETTNSFPGIKNKIKAEVKSDHVDAMVDGVILFQDVTSENDYALSWKDPINDWYVEARILDDMLTFGFHDEINPEGTYLPIWDDNVAAGNIGSEGFTLVYRPIEGLRLAASLPFTDTEANWLKVDGAQDDVLGASEKKTNIRLGAIYDMGIAEFGVAAHDILDSDELSFGFYVYSAGFFGVKEGLGFRAGFAHGENEVGFEKALFSNKKTNVTGKNFWNVAFEMPKLLPVGLTLEAAGNTDDADSDYDIYAAAKVDVGINEKLSLAVTGKTGLDLSDNGKDTAIEAIVALDISVSKKDKFEVSADFYKPGDDWNLKFPCYWKHTF